MSEKSKKFSPIEKISKTSNFANNLNSPQILNCFDRLQLSPMAQDSHYSEKINASNAKKAYNNQRNKTLRTNLNDTFRIVNILFFSALSLWIF